MPENMKKYHKIPTVYPGIYVIKEFIHREIRYWITDLDKNLHFQGNTYPDKKEIKLISTFSIKNY